MGPERRHEFHKVIPELQWTDGYPAVLLGIGAVPALVRYFERRDYIRAARSATTVTRSRPRCPRPAGGFVRA